VPRRSRPDQAQILTSTYSNPAVVLHRPNGRISGGALKSIEYTAVGVI
jgi:hypothetical protein